MCYKAKQKTRNQGFTLVELSIVIIIIGFLIAGIAAGTSLVKQAEISSVISDMQGFQTAYNNFILNYGEIPGDMPNADAYWTGSTCAASGNPKDCNGKGDGLITYETPTDESAIAWKELSLANMISAGIVPVDNTGFYTLGLNVPTSKVNGAGYLMNGASVDFDASVTVISPWNDNTTNAVFIGKVNTADGGLDYPSLKPEDAFNIDKKIDDGAIDANGNATGALTGNFRTIAARGVSQFTCIVGGGDYVLTTTTATCISGLALN